MPIPPFIEGLVSNIPPFEFIGIAIFANAFPAIPEEIFLISFGYLSKIQPEMFPFWKLIVFLIIGFSVVDSVVYLLAKRGSKIIDFIVTKVLDIDLKKNEHFLKEHTAKIVFISRFLVQLRTIGPITATTTGLPYRKFLAINLLALSIYTPVVMGLGHYFASRLEKILSGAHVLNNIMGTVGAIILGLIILRKLRKSIVKYLSKSEVNKPSHG